ncbi:hypothetical protein SDC9_208061 [bioreactor metagenome]|uniref:Uncharacterized protein n=1 Tax=bioreactor metagenome TaxID=1076179 RepID=A0A645JL20_9ZZZZ
MEGMGIRAGMHLAHARADPGGCLDLGDISIDEHAGHDASIRQPRNDLLEPGFLG